MAKQTWNISGRLRLEPQHQEVRTAFGDFVDLRGVRVKVSAKQFGLDVTGWEKWGEAVTDSNGSFTIRKEKNETRRRFKVEVQFKDDQLKIYGDNDSLLDGISTIMTALIPGPIDDWLADTTNAVVESMLEQTGRLAHTVPWYTVHVDDDKRSGPSVNLPTSIFGGGRAEDAGDDTARAHGEIWYLAKKYIGHINDQGEGFRRDRPVGVCYPHENPLIGDGVEASYANMVNDVAYLVKNSRRDDFDPEVLFHELEHLHLYQLTRGELSMASALVRNGTTHDGRLSDTFIGCHEALAEVVSNEVYRQLFKSRATVYEEFEAERRPFSRPHLRSQRIDRLADMSFFEAGWTSALSMLLCPDAYALDMEDPGPYARDPSPGSRSVATGITLGDLFDVLAHDGNRRDDGMHISDMDIPRFLAEVAHVVEGFTDDLADRYLEVIDPAETRSAWMILREPGSNTVPATIGDADEIRKVGSADYRISLRP